MNFAYLGRWRDPGDQKEIPYFIMITAESKEVAQALLNGLCSENVKRYIDFALIESRPDSSESY